MSTLEKMTIARVIARLNVGGPALQAILMTDIFQKKGYRSLLLTGEVPSGEKSMEYLANSLGVKPIKISSMSRRISWTRDLAAFLRIIGIFIREKPTIIHTHTAKAGALGRLAAILLRVPVRIHTFHGHVFEGYFSPAVTRFFLTLERILAKHTDCIIAVSPSQRSELVDKYHIASGEKVVSIPLGFHLDPFLRLKDRSGRMQRLRKDAPGACLVGWIGRLAPIKAPGLFVECCAALHRNHPSARFVMVGDGELREQCEQEIRRSGAETVITIIGWQQEIPSIYADLDVVVSTSLNEGTPLGLLEAMASAKPVVATDVGGVRDLMVGTPQQANGMEIFENGILVPQELDLVGRGVSYLLARPDLRREMGESGRRFVAGRFSVQRLANDLEDLYLSLAQKKDCLQRTSPSASEPTRILPSSEQVGS